MFSNMLQMTSQCGQRSCRLRASATREAADYEPVRPEKLQITSLCGQRSCRLQASAAREAADDEPVRPEKLQITSQSD